MTHPFPRGSIGEGPVFVKSPQCSLQGKIKSAACLGELRLSAASLEKRPFTSGDLSNQGSEVFLPALHISLNSSSGVKKIGIQTQAYHGVSLSVIPDLQEAPPLSCQPGMKQDPCQVQSTKDWGGVHCSQHVTSTEMALVTHSLPNHRPQGTMLKINVLSPSPGVPLKKYTVTLILSWDCGKDQKCVDVVLSTTDVEHLGCFAKC